MTLARRLDALAPDVIINPAAYTAVDRAEDERELAFTVNAESPGVSPDGRQRVACHWCIFPPTMCSMDRASGPGARTILQRRSVSMAPASWLAKRTSAPLAGPHLIVRTSWIYAARGNEFSAYDRPVGARKSRIDDCCRPDRRAYFGGACRRHPRVQIVRKNLGDLDAAFAAAGNTLHVAADGHTSWHGFASAIVDGLRRLDVALAVERIVPIATKDYPTKVSPAAEFPAGSDTFAG